MSSGSFRLWVKADDKRLWGILETAPYDDAARRKSEQRHAVFARIAMSRINWQHNYASYRDAAFCIEEQANEFLKPMHVEGTPRDRPRIKGKCPGGLKRKVPSWKQKPVHVPGKQKRKIPKKGKRHARHR